MLTASSCVSSEQKRLERAAATLGAVAANVNLPDLPEACRIQYERVGLADTDIGKDKIELISDANNRIVAANGTIKVCANFYDNTQKSFKETPVVVPIPNP